MSISRRAWLWAGALVVLGVSATVVSGGLASILFTTFIMAGIGLSMQVVYGLLGELSLGHSALFGAGAYTYALLFDSVGIPSAMLLGVLVGGIAGAVLGLVTVRMNGAYFAIVTFALAAVVMTVVAGTRSLGRDEGILGIESMASVPFLERINSQYLYAGLALMVSLALFRALRQSRLGLALETARVDRDLAMSQGLSVARLRVATMSLSGLVAGLFGAVFAQQARFVSPDVFGLHFIIVPLAVVAVGGIRFTMGTLAGAAVVVLLPRLLELPPVANQVFNGLSLVLVLLFLPDGLLGLSRRLGFGATGSDVATTTGAAPDLGETTDSDRPGVSA